MATASRVLTQKGYAILKSSLTTQQTDHLVKELTVKPKVMEAYARGVQSFPIYMESPTRFYVPRQWGITTYGEPEAITIGEGKEISKAIKFKGTPYDYQEKIIDHFITSGGNGLICVPCGRGKTFMALNIAVRLGRKCLIVVDKEFLMNQWKGEIENYIDGATVGILQGSTCQVGSETVYGKPYTANELKEMCKESKLKVSGSKDELLKRLADAGIDTTPKSTTIEYDITICMIQTICLREFPLDAFKDYGFTIFDECHHLGAQHFSGALRKIQTKWMLGLSATPNRDDGLTKVFEYYLGKAVYEEKTREPDPTVVVRAVWYQDEDPAYADVPVNYKGETITARLLTQVVDCTRRTELVLKILKELAEEKDRQILVLSERICHLDAIYADLDAENKAVSDEKYKVGYYIGGMKQAILDYNATNCQILLGTYAMASEAMNIKTLNTMIMASPRKKIEQSTGRILRTRPENRKVDPLIVDIIDQHETYVRQWWTRSKYYKKCAYKVVHEGKPEKEKEPFANYVGSRHDREATEPSNSGSGKAAGGAGRESKPESCMIVLASGDESD
jgi:superfamily II DNA or RNA helicase